jgi:hypothetical protein
MTTVAVRLLRALSSTEPLTTPFVLKTGRRDRCSYSPAARKDELMADNENQCEHAGCSCAKDQGSDYCSAYCEGASDTTEIKCGCGHDGCA